MYHCPACAVQWSATTLGYQCWACGADGTFGTHPDRVYTGSHWYPCDENEGPSPI